MLGLFGSKKTKEPSEQEKLAEKIGALTGNQCMWFRCPENWGGDFVAIELNPNAGKKYLLINDDVKDNAPAGKKKILYQTDKAAELAKWVMERQAVPFAKK